MNQLCKVCGEPAAGFHFGAFTCEGCKSFFGRTYNNVSGVSECKNGGRCEITKKNRTSCKSCRLRKCLSVGMSKSGSRYGRRSNWFKIHCLLSAQNQQNGLGSPETNNNSSTVTNNNNNNSNNNSHHIGHGLGGKGGLVNGGSLPPGLGSLIGGHSSGGDRDRGGHDRDRDRGDPDRPPTSSASRHLSSSGAPPPPSFTSLASLSPEAREQFLSTLNRNMGNPELCEYFRATSKHNNNNNNNKSSFYPDEGAEDMSRTTGGRSPGSLESPNSEASLDDKSNTPLFTMPPGSPLDVKPNDFSPFDLITRDLMKLGYDPLRLWPAMLTAPPNLHTFNPYRLIFPNFPPTPAAFPGSFPPHHHHSSPGGGGGGGGGGPQSLSSQQPPPSSMLLPSPNVNGLHNHLHNHHPSAKLLSSAAAAAAAAVAAENLALPLITPTNLVGRRLNAVVPPSSSLTLTPPISSHGADDPCFTSGGGGGGGGGGGRDAKFRNVPVQDSPIDLSIGVDLSARSILLHNNNNNNNDDDLVRVKGEIISSDMDDDEEEEREMMMNSDRDINSDEDMKDIKSEYNDSEEDEEEEEEGNLSEDGIPISRNNNNKRKNNNNNNIISSNQQSSRSNSSRRRRRSHSRSSCSPKRERVSTPLDLTRSTNHTNNSPPKIAT